MKNLIFTLLTLITITTYAQVGIGTTTPDASSILELDSTTQGMLTPRMTESERDLIATPATGLLIYQTDNTPGFYYYNSSAWVPFGGGGAEDHDWYQITSDDTPDHINDDIYTHGNVAVGNNAPTAKLHVTGTASGGSGGTNTILSQDFESSTLGFVTGAVSTNEYQTTAAGGTEVWRVVDASTDYVSVKCTSCTGQWIEMEYEFIDQDETFVSSQFFSSATATSLDITFDYRYRDYSLDATDTFTVVLYNETDNVIASTLIPTTSTDADTSYSGSYPFTGGNAPTDNYTIKFQYTGNGSYGASVDNIVVIENAIAAPASSVFRLEDGTEQAGYVLTSDANGNATWQAASGGGTDSQTLSITGDQLTISNGNTVTIPTGGGGGNSANNGLTLTGSTIQLGGDLIKDTTINIGDNDFIINGNSTTGYTGEMTLNGNNRIIFETEVDEDYINFGGTAFVDTDDGNTFSDTYGGGPYTIDFVLGAHNGSSGGTAIALGSIEYVVDGTDELFYEGSAFSPLSHLGADLGGDSFSGTTRWWDDVYAGDFVTETATYPIAPGGGRLSSPEMKGLKELLLLNPVSYKEQVNMVGKTKIPDHLKDIKLGFHADQLVKIIPEAVKTSDWVALDESGKRTRIVKKNPKGIKMLQIIPVTVKAIQEQQEQIEVLKSEISELKELVNRLISEKK